MKQTKRIVSLCLLFVMLLGVFPLSVFADDLVIYCLPDGNIWFDRETGTIVSADPELHSAQLPSNIFGTKVTAIGDWAFATCPNLTKVVLPGTITSIGEHAFADCHSLGYVVFPRSLKEIGDCAFNCCTSLEAAIIPEGVTSIGKYAFADCVRLTEVDIPQV